MTISSVRARAVSVPKSLSAMHSAVRSPRVYWSPGQGMRPPPGVPVRQRGVYLSGTVKAGQTLKIESVKLNRTTKVMTVKADARGKATSTKGQQAEVFVSGSFGFQPERWKVIIVDHAGKTLKTQYANLGGPPAV